MTILPDHLADLRASGLNDQTIELMRVESVEPADWLKAKGVQSAYRLPYLELKDCPYFYRDKLLPSLTDDKGKTRKYDQPRGGGCHLYVLEPVVDLLSDFTKPIFVVEGEKKSAAGWQAGLGCVVGVGGIWNFLDKTSGELIPEFDRIAWRNRENFYIPDSDVWAREDLQQACYEFGIRIHERGGLKFYFIQLTPGQDGAKRGLDDFLLTDSVDALMKLPKITLGGRGWTKEKKAHKAREAKRDKRAADETEEEKQEEIPQSMIVNAWATRDLITAVTDTLKRFVLIKDARKYQLLAIWTLSTYVYEVFDYMPILWVTSPTPRSGKTRLLEVLTQLSSRSSGILINPTEAILFRKTNRGSTLILDEVEKLKNKDRDTHGAIMAILNSGFQKGATVPRVQKGKDGVLSEVDYKTYGPKIIAGLSNVSDTIADRSLVIKMVRRVRATEILERFRLRKLIKELGDLVLQLKVWARAKSKDIEAIYDGMAQEPEELKDCDDRFLDIVEPLMTIAALADAENSNGGSSVLDELITILKSFSSDRDETQNDAAIVVALDTIGSILGDNSKLFVPSADMLKAFEDKPAIAWIKTGKSLATFLGKIDLRPKQEGGGRRRGYEVDRSWLSDMITRYPSTEANEVSQVPQSELFQELTEEKPSVTESDCDT